MGELNKLFDSYSLNARVKPAFLLVFPIIISVFTLFEPSRSWGGATITFLISFGIISFAANQLSTQGNILQEKLFSKWGGAPTTLILRHSDSRLDSFTKSRYMITLETLIPNFTAISIEEELDNTKTADEIYSTATYYMKEYTRDTIKYPLIFKENIAYGFSRNVRAFKWLGITISICSLTITSIIAWYKHVKENDAHHFDLFFIIPFETTALIFSLIIITFLWICLVTEKWVEVRAFAYAKSLFAACDNQIHKN